MATNAITLDNEAFSRLVVEEKLYTWEMDAYVYTGMRTKDGWQIYRTLTGGSDGFGKSNWDTIGPSTLSTANPAAGADPALWTVPAGKRWLIIAVFNYGTTAVAVANRYPYLHIKGDASVSSQIIVGATPITASITTQYVTFAAGAASGGAVGNSLGLTIGIGQGIEVAAGGTIRVQYLNIQGADDFGPATITYKEVDA